jgi:hypothetical protein
MSKLNWNRTGFFLLGAFFGSYVLGLFGGVLGGARMG